MIFGKCMLIKLSIGRPECDPLKIYPNITDITNITNITNTTMLYFTVKLIFYHIIS